MASGMRTRQHAGNQRNFQGLVDFQGGPEEDTVLLKTQENIENLYYENRQNIDLNFSKQQSVKSSQPQFSKEISQQCDFDGRIRREDMIPSRQDRGGTSMGGYRENMNATVSSYYNQPQRPRSVLQEIRITKAIQWCVRQDKEMLKKVMHQQAKIERAKTTLTYQQDKSISYQDQFVTINHQYNNSALLINQDKKEIFSRNYQTIGENNTNNFTLNSQIDQVKLSQKLNQTDLYAEQYQPTNQSQASNRLSTHRLDFQSERSIVDHNKSKNVNPYNNHNSSVQKKMSNNQNRNSPKHDSSMQIPNIHIHYKEIQPLMFQINKEVPYFDQFSPNRKFSPITKEALPHSPPQTKIVKKNDQLSNAMIASKNYEIDLPKEKQVHRLEPKDIKIHRKRTKTANVKIEKPIFMGASKKNPGINISDQSRNVLNYKTSIARRVLKVSCDNRQKEKVEQYKQELKQFKKEKQIEEEIIKVAKGDEGGNQAERVAQLLENFAQIINADFSELETYMSRPYTTVGAKTQTLVNPYAPQQNSNKGFPARKVLLNRSPNMTAQNKCRNKDDLGKVIKMGSTPVNDTHQRFGNDINQRMGTDSGVYTIRGSSLIDKDEISNTSIQDYADLPEIVDGHGRFDSTMSLEMEKNLKGSNEEQKIEKVADMNVTQISIKVQRDSLRSKQDLKKLQKGNSKYINNEMFEDNYEYVGKIKPEISENSKVFTINALTHNQTLRSQVSDKLLHKPEKLVEEQKSKKQRIKNFSNSYDNFNVKKVYKIIQQKSSKNNVVIEENLVYEQSVNHYKTQRKPLQYRDKESQLLQQQHSYTPIVYRGATISKKSINEQFLTSQDDVINQKQLNSQLNSSQNQNLKSKTSRQVISKLQGKSIEGSNREQYVSGLSTNQKVEEMKQHLDSNSQDSSSVGGNELNSKHNFLVEHNKGEGETSTINIISNQKGFGPMSPLDSTNKQSLLRSSLNKSDLILKDMKTIQENPPLQIKELNSSQRVIYVNDILVNPNEKDKKKEPQVKNAQKIQQRVAFVQLCPQEELTQEDLNLQDLRSKTQIIKQKRITDQKRHSHVPPRLQKKQGTFVNKRGSSLNTTGNQNVKNIPKKGDNKSFEMTFNAEQFVLTNYKEPKKEKKFKTIQTSIQDKNELQGGSRKHSFNFFINGEMQILQNSKGFMNKNDSFGSNMNLKTMNQDKTPVRMKFSNQDNTVEGKSYFDSTHRNIKGGKYRLNFNDDSRPVTQTQNYRKTKKINQQSHEVSESGQYHGASKHTLELQVSHSKITPIDMVEQSQDKVAAFISKEYYGSYLEALKEFVRIPSLSPIFDEKWQENGNLYKQCDHLISYLESQNIKGAKVMPKKDEGKTPFLIVDIEASDPSKPFTVLLYGHMDKQPFGDGWNTDPCDPVVKDGFLFGRGAVDDGYSFFTAILAIKACQEYGLPHPRCIITIEGSEEGEIDDLVYYMDKYKELLGNPDLVICLDAGGFSNQTLGIVTTLKGCQSNLKEIKYLDFDLTVKIAQNNMHSGLNSQITPNPFNILTNLVSRVMDISKHQVIPELQADVPEHRKQEIRVIFLNLTKQALSQILPNPKSQTPLFETTQSLQFDKGADENYHLILNNFWAADLCVIGQEGLPSIETAGNVVYKQLTWRMSLRLPPSLDWKVSEEILKKKFFEEKPDTYGAIVEYKDAGSGNGFDPPKLPEDLSKKLYGICNQVFGKDPLFNGMGGSIPFMEVFSTHFPKANYLLTGAAFPTSNAHAANENFDLEYGRKFTILLSHLLTKIAE